MEWVLFYQVPLIEKKKMKKFAFIAFMAFCYSPAAGLAATPAEGMESHNCQDGMLNIRPHVPSFGYLRCSDKIYSLIFNASLYGDTYPFCNIQAKSWEGRDNRLECKTMDNKIIILTWPNGEIMNGKMITAGTARYPTAPGDPLR